MMNNLPLRRTTLHLAQRFRMEGETFMNSNLLRIAKGRNQVSQSFHYICSFDFRLVASCSASGLKDSQDERLAFGDSHTMLEVRRQ
jgi:hypothetical protein